MWNCDNILCDMSWKYIFICLILHSLCSIDVTYYGLLLLMDLYCLSRANCTAPFTVYLFYMFVYS